MDQVKIYVYGSCHYSNRSAGYGVVVSINGELTHKISGGYSNSSDPRIVIIGITEGIKRIETASNILVYSANSYVINTLAGVTKTKKNIDLWQKLNKILRENNHSITYLLSNEAKEKSNLLLAENLAKAKSKEKNLPPDVLEEINNDTQELYSEIEQIILGSKIPVEGIYVKVFSIEHIYTTKFQLIDILSKKILLSVNLEVTSLEVATFLALISALVILKKNGEEKLIVYCNNAIAISWVKQKKCESSQIIQDNKKIHDDISRAENWLKLNQYKNKISEWNESQWGSITGEL